MLTLNYMLNRAVRLHGDSLAIVDAEASYTWAEHADRVARAASVLASLGVEKGERFGVVSRNSFRQFEILNAGFWLGAIPVPVNTRLAAPEIAYIFENAECGLVVVEDFFAGIMESEELAPWAGNVLAIGSGGGSGGPEYETLLAKAKPLPTHWPAEDDDAILLYTGGTTGRGKGVRLSHRNVVSDGMATGFEIETRQDDVYLHVAPMFHSADLYGTCFTMSGAAHAFLPVFSGRALLEIIQSLKVTASMLTPTMIIMMLQEKDFARYDLSSLRHLLYGSSPMAAEWIEKSLKAFKGTELVQGYGLTETSPLLTMLPMSEHVRAIETGNLEILRGIGRPLPGVEMRIHDADGNDLPPGQPGEIVVRAPNVSLHGYLKRPEETKKAFRGGWFHTGDIARMDEHGYVYLLDRKNDMIITGGENVYSSEVEAVLYQHSEVHECAVVGVPDETYGEALLAAIVPAPGASLDEQELIAHCRELIGGYKIPRRYVFLEELPKSAMNKILKNELRATYGGKPANSPPQHPTGEIIP